jgi:hypothetical protein
MSLCYYSGNILLSEIWHHADLALGLKICSSVLKKFNHTLLRPSLLI